MSNHEEIDRTRAAGEAGIYEYPKHVMTKSESSSKRPAEQRDPREHLLRRITNSKPHFSSRVMVSRQLLGDEAPALWHLVGHPPQATHLDSTFKAHSVLSPDPVIPFSYKEAPTG